MLTSDMTAKDWKNMINGDSATLCQLANQLNQHYKKWYDYQYGLTNTQLSGYLGLSEDEVAQMKIAFDDLKDFVGFMRNAAVTTRDRETDFIRFV